MRGAQIGQISTVAGIVVATLTGTISVNLPIIIGGVGTLILAVILATLMPEEGFIPQQKQAGKNSRWNIFGTFTSGLQEVRQRPVLRSVIWIGIIVGGSAGGFDALYTPHIVQNYEIPLFQPVIWYGILTGGVTILTIFALEIAKRFLVRNTVFPVSSLLAVFALGTVAGNLVFVWTGNFYILLVAFWVSQTLRTATKPLFMAWVNRHSSSGVRATVISMYWQSNASGNIIWTPVLGLLASLMSLRMALTGAALLLLPVIPVYRQHRNAPEPISSD